MKCNDIVGSPGSCRVGGAVSGELENKSLDSISSSSNAAGNSNLAEEAAVVKPIVAEGIRSPKIKRRNNLRKLRAMKSREMPSSSSKEEEECISSSRADAEELFEHSSSSPKIDDHDEDEDELRAARTISPNSLSSGSRIIKQSGPRPYPGKVRSLAGGH